MWQNREPTKKERLAQFIRQYWLVIILMVGIAAALVAALDDPPTPNPHLVSTATQLVRLPPVSFAQTQISEALPNALPGLARVTLNPPLSREHVALVRDISQKGVFFYSDFHPSVGDQLNFVVEFLNKAEGIRLHLKGAVVRVEQVAPGSAPGVAVSFDSQRGKKRWTGVQEASRVLRGTRKG